MNSYELLDAIGGIDTEYIKAADLPVTRKKAGYVLRWAVTAACVCLAAGIGMIGFRYKGGFDSHVEETASLMFNGAYYEATDIPEVLERYGLPGVITENMAGEHISWLQPEGAGYKESASETDIELMQYAPASCRGVYIIRDGRKYLAALFCNIVMPDSNTNTGMDTLYQFYDIAGSEDIASITEMDWNRNKTVGNAVTDSSEITDFYQISLSLVSYGNDDFQAIVFDGIPEEQQAQAHSEFADDLRVIRIETKDGLRFFVNVYPSYGWIYGNGTNSYYQIDGQMADWISRNLH